ncbi:uncharacterized protein BDR25DRAFT_354859 [Lindgomyces ingoldianus]|uniref:Uncharacterized protein n=1 Tax=Lindgomyces ingoldianus TaxID=673940 RepID=A0ACB6QXV9_9PLEO|nr:uncharacterized protein BDR25DRAFT_354859 [Lindgomyces ingoldianus]KAF2470915.1 hypothetical protein BDR25DRAFT_354859 [Lindgomyces ingoldianus]
MEPHRNQVMGNGLHGFGVIGFLPPPPAFLWDSGHLMSNIAEHLRQFRVCLAAGWAFPHLVLIRQNIRSLARVVQYRIDSWWIVKDSGRQRGLRGSTSFTFWLFAYFASFVPPVGVSAPWTHPESLGAAASPPVRPALPIVTPHGTALPSVLPRSSTASVTNSGTAAALLSARLSCFDDKVHITSLAVATCFSQSFRPAGLIDETKWQLENRLFRTGCLCRAQRDRAGIAAAVYFGGDIGLLTSIRICYSTLFAESTYEAHAASVLTHLSRRPAALFTGWHPAAFRPQRPVRHPIDHCPKLRRMYMPLASKLGLTFRAACERLPLAYLESEQRGLRTLAHFFQLTSPSICLHFLQDLVAYSAGKLRSRNLHGRVTVVLNGFQPVGWCIRAATQLPDFGSGFSSVCMQGNNVVELSSSCSIANELKVTQGSKYRPQMGSYQNILYLFSTPQTFHRMFQSGITVGMIHYRASFKCDDFTKPPSPAFQILRNN